MSRTLFPIQRLLGASLILAAASLPAAAQQAQPAQAARADATPTADAMTVVRDPDTGILRAASADEQAALNASKVRFNARFAVPQPLPKTHASGAVGVRMTDEFVNAASLVATRGADGKVTVAHGDADHAAEATTRPVNAATE